MPSTGARISVRSRSTRACASCDSRCFTTASALRTCACPTADLRLLRFQLLARGLERRERLVADRRGDEVLLEQHLVAVVLALGVAEQHFRARELRLQRGDVRALRQRRRARGFDVGHRLVHPQRERLRIDARDQLAFLHRRVVVGVELLDLTRDLRADLHRDDRIERARCSDRGGDRAALDFREAIRGRRRERVLPPDVAARRTRAERHDEEEIERRFIRGMDEARMLQVGLARTCTGCLQRSCRTRPGSDAGTKVRRALCSSR